MESQFNNRPKTRCFQKANTMLLPATIQRYLKNPKPGFNYGIAVLMIPY